MTKIVINYRDQVSDAVLDACLREDPQSKVSIQMHVLVSTIKI